jgi:hypothetical protein
MDFDDQMRRYFGTTELEALTPARWRAGRSGWRSSSGWSATGAGASRCGR